MPRKFRPLRVIVIVSILVSSLAGCSALSPPLAEPQVEAFAARLGEDLVATVSPVTGVLSADEAVARAVAFNRAIKAKELEALFGAAKAQALNGAMLPAIVGQSEYYRRDRPSLSHSNQSAGYSTSTDIGTISRDDIKITPYHPQQRCTIASVAGHSMYERETPYYEHTLGGTLDVSECHYEQFDERTARITGAKWVPAIELRVKIEGARKIGERYMGFVGLRDPHIVRNVDAAIEWCKTAVVKRFGKEQYELYFHVFGKNGVLKELEPVRETQAHELGIVVEGLAATDELAAKITDFAVRMFFLVRIPGVKGTAGAAATTKKTMKSSPGYMWNINHTVPIDDPMELFPVHVTEGGV